MIVTTYDVDGTVLGSRIESDEYVLQKKETNLLCVEKFLITKFNGLSYEEGATQEEIDEIKKSLIPLSVKKSNFKLALIKAGISTSVITEAIYSMPASLQKDRIIILWEDTDIFYRDDESLNLMAPTFNISQGQLDQLFILANQL